jgi:hypothetical protein
VPRKVHSPLEKALIGPAGEHYVLYRLYCEGMLASLAPPRTPTIDILVLDPNETVIATLQVKTTTVGVAHGWPMNVKHETFVRPRCFYAFVDLKPETPVVYIVPSKVVAEVVRQSHKAWLTAPGRRGQPHKDNPVRRLGSGYADLPGYEEGWLEAYRERWDLLRDQAQAELATSRS